jgi:hypothetical protein
MIEIFNEGKGNTESFESYDALLKHIKSIEKQKQLGVPRRKPPNYPVLCILTKHTADHRGRFF